MSHGTPSTAWITLMAIDTRLCGVLCLHQMYCLCAKHMLLLFMLWSRARPCSCWKQGIVPVQKHAVVLVWKQDVATAQKRYSVPVLEQVG